MNARVGSAASLRQEAVAPPEARGLKRDEVRLLVSETGSDRHHHFLDLPDVLLPGDLVVVNRSATLPASLPARSSTGPFLLNLSTAYGRNIWLAEPRWAWDRPGPIPLSDGEGFLAGGLRARRIAGYPGVPRLVFVRFEGDLRAALEEVGRPIRYGYVPRPYPLSDYQTIFAQVPGSAEMPSAGRPFSARIVSALRERGVSLSGIVLHSGVSSLEREDFGGSPALFPEPFCVPETTVAAVERTHESGGRVVAVGTTVVRALESALAGGRLRAARGYTLTAIGRRRAVGLVDGLLTGFHEPRSTHLELLTALLGAERLARAYRAAVHSGYLWHEFGDVHLMFRTSS